MNKRACSDRNKPVYSYQTNYNLIQNATLMIAKNARTTNRTGTKNFAIALSTMPLASLSAFLCNMTGKIKSKIPGIPAMIANLNKNAIPNIATTKSRIEKILYNIDFPLITSPPDASVAQKAHSIK